MHHSYNYKYSDICNNPLLIKIMLSKHINKKSLKYKPLFKSGVQTALLV